MAQQQTYPTIRANGQTMPANVWGRATLLLQLLYRQGSLPDLHIYGQDGPDVDPGMFFINGEPVGKTDAEVTDSIWRMVECSRVSGYLFESPAVCSECAEQPCESCPDKAGAGA